MTVNSPNACPYTPAELLPHDPPMILLDQVQTWDAEGVTAAVTIGPATPFLAPVHGVPAHVGLEWMAQTCGVFAGLESKLKAEPVRVGFLLGTRRYLARRSWFPEGETLSVAARLMLREGGMAVFDCRILAADGTEEASAQLTLYQPGDVSSVLAHRTME